MSTQNMCFYGELKKSGSAFGGNFGIFFPFLDTNICRGHPLEVP